jgi:tRNA (guanosine-2'-O-)-methyltransferase
MKAVASCRTRQVTLVFEDIDKPHNVSAVLRTAECMGVQDVHFIKNRFQYRANPRIVMGSLKWLTVFHHNTHPNEENVVSCFNQLRSRGYKILATSLHERSVTIDELDITGQPLAIVFGSEGSGVSPLAASLADGFVYVPMVGFTESYNLSVSAALIIKDVLTKLKKEGRDIALSGAEQDELLALWLKKSVKASDMILKRKHEQVG